MKKLMILILPLLLVMIISCTLQNKDATGKVSTDDLIDYYIGSVAEKRALELDSMLDKIIKTFPPGTKPDLKELKKNSVVKKLLFIPYHEAGLLIQMYKVGKDLKKEKLLNFMEWRNKAYPEFMIYEDCGLELVEDKNAEKKRKDKYKKYKQNWAKEEKERIRFLHKRAIVQIIKPEILDYKVLQKPDKLDYSYALRNLKKFQIVKEKKKTGYEKYRHKIDNKIVETLEKNHKMLIGELPIGSIKYMPCYESVLLAIGKPDIKVRIRVWMEVNIFDSEYKKQGFIIEVLDDKGKTLNARKFITGIHIRDCWTYCRDYNKINVYIGGAIFHKNNADVKFAEIFEIDKELNIKKSNFYADPEHGEKNRSKDHRELLQEYSKIRKKKN